MKQCPRQSERHAVLTVFGTFDRNAEHVLRILRPQNGNVQHALRLVCPSQRIENIKQHANRLNPRRRKRVRTFGMLQRIFQSAQQHLTARQQRQPLRILAQVNRMQHGAPCRMNLSLLKPLDSAAFEHLRPPPFILRHGRLHSFNQLSFQQGRQLGDTP